jgi:hypothetical protein
LARVTPEQFRAPDADIAHWSPVMAANIKIN